MFIVYVERILVDCIKIYVLKFNEIEFINEEFPNIPVIILLIKVPLQMFLFLF